MAQFSVGATAKYFSATDRERRLLCNAGGGALYYSKSQSVSSSSKEGELAAGEAHEMSFGLWVVSASQTGVEIFSTEDSGGAGGGDVNGPASSVESDVAVFSGTSGRKIKDGGKTIAAIEAVAKAEVEAVSTKLNNLAIFNVKDYGAKGNGTTDDATAIQAAITAIEAAVIGVLYFPRGIYLVGSTIIVPEKTVVAGAGMMLSEVKLKGTANVDVFKSKNYETTGANYIEFEKIAVNGNKAENASAGCGIKLDGQRCRYRHLRVFNCREDNIIQKKTASDIAPSLGGGDSKADDVVSYGAVGAGLRIFAHDFVSTNVQGIECEGGNIVTESTAFAAVFNSCHPFGASPYAFNINASAEFVNCEAEGGSTAQVRINKVAVKWLGGRVFAGTGGSPNIPGFEIIGNVANLTTRGVVILEVGTGGAFRAVESEAGSGSSLDFKLESGGGNVAFAKAEGGTFSPGIAIYPNLRGTAVIGTPPGPVSLASAEEIAPIANITYYSLTGAVEVKKIKATFAGHFISLVSTGASKVISGENIKLQGNFVGAPNRSLALECDGTNWIEVGRSPTFNPVAAAPTAFAARTESEEIEISTTRTAVVTARVTNATLTGTRLNIKVGGILVAEKRFSAVETGTGVDTITFTVPAATKFIWAKSEGTVESFQTSHVLL